MIIRISLLTSLLLIACASTVTAQQIQIGIEQFDRWIFRGTLSEQQTRKSMEDSIEIEIDRLEQSMELKDLQKARIRLAGRGDINRFFDRVDIARREFRALEGNLNQNNINDAFQLAMPLQQEISKGIFHQRSLIKKVIHSTMDAEQAEMLRRKDKRLQMLRGEVAIKAYVAQLGRQIPMTASQRNRVLEIAMAWASSFDGGAEYSSILIGYRLSELPQEEFIAVFDASQAEAWAKVMRQGRTMKAFLKKQGLLDGK